MNIEARNTHTRFGVEVDISISEALAALETSQSAIGERPCNCLFYTKPHVHRDLHIFFRGKWRVVCRTDLRDNVATGGDVSGEAAEALAFFKGKVRYGARILDNGEFAVIDSITDG